MKKPGTTPESGLRHVVVEQVSEIWDNLGKRKLWKRILKNVVATTTLVSICLIPGVESKIGKAAYLGAIASVFGHPGRRFGQMAEALILALSGTLLGVAWSTLGVYLGSLVFEDNPPAAYAIRAIFLAVAVIFHGFLRSGTPRLFILVLLTIICSTVTLVGTAHTVTSVGATQILYPILLAIGVLLVVNLCIFPEFSSAFLGEITIETLNDTAKALEEAGQYFVVSAGLPYRTDTSQRDKGAELLQGGDFDPESLGQTTTDTDRERESVSLPELTDKKARIRKKLSDCKDAQKECNFELAVSVLPPRDLKPLSHHSMKSLVANVIAVIGACESKFALVGPEDSADLDKVADVQENGNEQDIPGSSHNFQGSSLINMVDKPSNIQTSAAFDGEKTELDAIKPIREIEYGDVRLFRYLTARIAQPYIDLHSAVARTVLTISACIAYVYDVPKLPSGAKAPSGIILEELDLHMETLQKSLVQFDADAASALGGATSTQGNEGLEPDVMPREEVFLISSFMLNVRQAATHLEQMLKLSRDLVQRRQQRHDRIRVYAPHIKWSNWLYTGGQEEEALPPKGRKAKRQGTSDDSTEDKDDIESFESQTGLLARAREQGDLEKNAASAKGETPTVAPRTKPDVVSLKDSHLKSEPLPLSLRMRGQAADTLEWVQNSEDLLYAIKLTIAFFLVAWPAFIASWNTWYSLNRGLWAALQLILISEVSIGTSVMTFVLRGIGTTLGCIWGWAAVEARHQNRIVCAAMICIGIFPCAYVQLGTKYPKAGIVTIVSMCVVALSAELKTVPGTATDDFLKRWIAFLIGGCVALIVQVVLLPVKARTRLVESLASALHLINEMEQCIASGIEEGVEIDIYSEVNLLRFEDASSKAQGALDAAETFRMFCKVLWAIPEEHAEIGSLVPFCNKEPRIKGSFEGLALIYTEILFVLRQIVDRMDNMLQLRTAYGSGPLEELNADISPYRRNVAGAITLTLFAIHSALTTKIPLPQFLPSARLAHLRMINRVRDVVLQKVRQDQKDPQLPETATTLARRKAVRGKYLSWNATSAAQAEIIEYLEELIDLTKLLVGANEFRSGLLERPTYSEYSQQRGEGEGKGTAVEEGAVVGVGEGERGGLKKRSGVVVGSGSDGGEVPASLRRIQSRKLEAGIAKVGMDG